MESDSNALPDTQAAPEASGGGHGHHYQDSDDPLAWLRESVPGKENIVLLIWSALFYGLSELASCWMSHLVYSSALPRVRF